MADTTQDTLYERFAEAAEGLTSSLGNLSDRLGATPASEGSAQASTASNSSGESAGSEALSIATTVLESGLGIVPLITGLVEMFTGGSATPMPLVKYAMPEQMQYFGADTGSGMSEADFDQMGMPREFDGSPDGSPSQNSAPTSAAAMPGSAAAGPQIQVTVQAIDAQSFLDRSGDIAQAVRTAMLNLSSLNDVVSDL